MRKAPSLTLLGVTLLVACAAAHAQPAAQPKPRSERDERCREAALMYVHPSPDKKYLTEEAEYEYEYEQNKKYLRLCGKSDDNFTRSVEESVAGYEAARRCEETTWPQYSKRVEVADSATPERKGQAYEAAKEFLKVCGHYNTRSTWYATKRVEEYDADVRLHEAERTLASLVPAARARAAAEVGPETYARIAEAYVVARYEPAQLRFARLNGRERAAHGKRVSHAKVREARARMNAALDRVVDAYARAVASCGDGAACRASKASWEKSLQTYYAFRYDGPAGGLEETIARALGGPMPNLLTR